VLVGIYNGQVRTTVAKFGEAFFRFSCLSAAKAEIAGAIADLWFEFSQ
jgi:hypothetical protein